MFYYDIPDFETDSDIEIDFDADINFDTEIKLDVYKDVDVDVKVETDVEGNSAFLVADVQAIGKDTYVQVDTAVMTIEDQLSSVTVSAESVVG
ncbi:hypothetical protein JL100_030720 (plasmid) [Skermanella mucosa]|uniref:hypothetical protein n=1 Tax=Skermanella mucosa TaxID=1789672 RepID=UPI00192C611A|nr:hypothetical protein [Skermanella mucosa]UEM24589.1 hypothetical protein JL100_030720 [Skermanella mucosa]